MRGGTRLSQRRLPRRLRPAEDHHIQRVPLSEPREVFFRPEPDSVYMYVPPIHIHYSAILYLPSHRDGGHEGVEGEQVRDSLRSSMPVGQLLDLIITCTPHENHLARSTSLTSQVQAPQQTGFTRMGRTAATSSPRPATKRGGKEAQDQAKGRAPHQAPRQGIDSQA